VKKIVGLIVAIGVVVGLIGSGTWAVFSDTEIATDNTLQAGTIDIAIDGENPWETWDFTEELADMKPCQVRYIEFRITNVGENPVVLWKHIEITERSGGDAVYQGVSSEPEYVAEGAVWTGSGWNTSEWHANDDVDSVILYDLSVDDTVIISEEDGLHMSDIECAWMPLGTLESDASMIVEQSYHMDADAGNQYQGDVLTFNIEIYGEQRLGNGPAESLDNKLFLDNKSGDPDWYFVADDMWGMLEYSPSGTAFVYDLYAQGLQAGTSYSLIYYADPWPNSGGALIGTHTTDGSGVISVTGQSTDIGMDITDGKIWLVLSDDGDAPMTGWNPTEYLFEGNKINYTDTDV